MDVPLAHLEPRLLRIVEPGKFYENVDRLAVAQGVVFLCPKCFIKNNGCMGTHSCICWFLGRGVLDTEEPKPGRWEAHGAGLADLTLVAGSSSVLLTEGCKAHFFVRRGAVQLLGA